MFFKSQLNLLCFGTEVEGLRMKFHQLYVLKVNAAQRKIFPWEGVAPDDHFLKANNMQCFGWGGNGLAVQS